MPTIRQGDVLPISTTDAEITPQHREVPREADGRLILAEGETSHHHHVVRGDGVCLLRAEGINDRVLTVARDLCELVTEGGEIAPGVARHTALSVPRGTYRVVLQREWTGEEVRNAQD